MDLRKAHRAKWHQFLVGMKAFVGLKSLSWIDSKMFLYRFDFGKWNDVKDVFFGRYDALVEFNSAPENTSYTSEGDWFDPSDSDWTSIDFTQGGEGRNVTWTTTMN